MRGGRGEKESRVAKVQYHVAITHSIRIHRPSRLLLFKTVPRGERIARLRSRKFNILSKICYANVSDILTDDLTLAGVTEPWKRESITCIYRFARGEKKYFPPLTVQKYFARARICLG